MTQVSQETMMFKRNNENKDVSANNQRGVQSAGRKKAIILLTSS